MKTRLGFQIYDDGSDPRPVVIDEERGGALVFGSKSAIRLLGNGILPAHFVVLPHEGMLLAASSNPLVPARVNGILLGKDWTVLELPCRVQVGTAVVDFVVIPLEATAPRPHAHADRHGGGRDVPHMDDLEGTRVGPLPSAGRTPYATQPSHAGPPVSARGPASGDASARSVSSVSIRSMRPREITMLAACRLRDDYKQLSRPKRLLAPIAVLLIVLSCLPTRAEAAASSANEMELAPRTELPGGGATTPTTASATSATSATTTTATSATPATTALHAPAGPGAAPSPGAPANVLLPSARSLPAAGAAKLTVRERVIYHRAIEATLAGDFPTAFRLYDSLSQAHPEATEIKAAQRVLASKMKR